MINKKLKIFVIISLIIAIVEVLMIIHIKKETKQVASEKTDENDKSLEEVFQEITNIEELEELEELVEIEEKQDDKKDDKINNNNAKQSTNYTKKYYIKVNNGAQVVNIYTKDENGNYTKPVKAMICSTGDDTPQSGTYKIAYRWEWLGLFGNVAGHWVTQIVGNILFHSVPYVTKYDPGSLEYWEYDKLGTKASMGCVRLKVEDAKWIYDNCASGTIVEFYSDSNPGPFGKPTSMKISDAEEPFRNWDPTDPNPANPWKNINTSEPQEEPITPESPTDNPNNPEEPEVPEVPTEPDNPTEEPEEPEVPNEPENPEEPIENPEEPTTPTEPEAPEVLSAE